MFHAYSNIDLMREQKHTHTRSGGDLPDRLRRIKN